MDSGSKDCRNGGVWVSRSQESGSGGLLAACFARFVQARANLREIPEDVSVRKPPLKKKKRGGNGH